MDDTPGVIVVSGFDSLRREIGRRSMEKLILDGRIHPARIEEVVANTRREIEGIVTEAGRQACYDANLHGLHPRAMQMLGRLKFRTSRGQNVLSHSMEVANIAGLLAGELKLDVQLAKRCGLLHDIGKAGDQHYEGSHAEIGADIARRCDENDVVVNAIAGHHEEVPPSSAYTILVSTANVISKARPGAQREVLEKFIKRMKKLEDLTREYEGVQEVHAIQAGRQIRIIVDPDNIADDQAVVLCRKIANRVQEETTYPSEVKVTVLRENRLIEFAR